jgi:hypothetical protein
MGRHRTEGNVESFMKIYKQGGVKAFWAGTGPKMMESSSKVRAAAQGRAEGVWVVKENERARELCA